MKKKKEVSALILLVAVLMLSMGFMVNSNETTTQMRKVDTVDIKELAASASLLVTEDRITEDAKSVLTDIELEIAPSTVKRSPIEIYDSMSIAQRTEALYAGTLHMEYSGLYTYYGDRLSVAKGAIYFNGHKETYYSQRVLPGYSLNIPGRHVADDGTVRDGNGYICVAANPSFMAKGSVLITSLGPAKVYDSGCSHGIIDIYVNW
ncbi:MAG: hypothetical protein IKQ06_00350 [Bacilli bacterium]|nr:hypothetical protein [Bacilli bacterium]